MAVYGRDASDAKLLAKTGRFLFYRDSGPTLTFTRLQQVEHEAYLTLRAGQAGVTAPEVIEAGRAGPSGDALIVCRLPPGTMLSAARPEDVTDPMLDSLIGQVLTLRAARLAHGEISGDTVLLDPVTQTAALTNYRSATAQASEYLLDRDLAGAIAAAAVVVGAERAAAAAARCLSAEVLTGVLQHLRRAGLDPHPGARPARPQEAARPGAGAGGRGQVDRAAQAGRAAADQLDEPDPDRRHADRRLGADRRARST